MVVILSAPCMGIRGAPMVMEGFMPGTAAGAGSERQTDGREEVPNANGLQQRQGAPAPAWGGAAQRAELQRQVVRRSVSVSLAYSKSNKSDVATFGWNIATNPLILQGVKSHSGYGAVNQLHRK